MQTQLIRGDCMEAMKGMADNSVDAVVVDPPYGLSFMGKKWDYDVPKVQVWAECLRVLKPGGHLLSFAGTRTQHRICCNIEDAGFEIRDMIAWVYGSGFPKSLDIGKAIDKAAGAEREVVGTGTAGKGFNKIKGFGENTTKGGEATTEWDVTDPATEGARQWDGWGTGLKPAFEPITLACKPLDIINSDELYEITGWDYWCSSTKKQRTYKALHDKVRSYREIIDNSGNVVKTTDLGKYKRFSVQNYVANVLKWGTGGINVDGCRVETGDSLDGGGYDPNNTSRKDLSNATSYATKVIKKEFVQPKGRFPANLIHNGSDEVVGMFPETATWGCPRGKHSSKGMYGMGDNIPDGPSFAGDSGSAARFFYVAKSSKSDRNKGLDSTCMIRYNVRKTLLNGDILCKDAVTEAVALLKRATSGLTLSWSIGECGESIMALCQRDSLSTTLTEISKITESKILSLPQPSHTSESIAGVSCDQTDGGSPAENVEPLSESKQTTTKGPSELARGVRLVVSEMLSRIKNADEWKPLVNFHSTVKPTPLMQYLCRLITPPDGIVLDPFMGSGSTGKACVREGFGFIGIELDPEYFKIAQKRIKAVEDEFALFR